MDGPLLPSSSPSLKALPTLCFCGENSRGGVALFLSRRRCFPIIGSKLSRRRISPFAIAEACPNAQTISHGILYRASHQLESRDLVCLLSGLATGWKAGSGFHSALGRLATPEFIYEQSLLLS